MVRSVVAAPSGRARRAGGACSPGRAAVTYSIAPRPLELRLRPTRRPRRELALVAADLKLPPVSAASCCSGAWSRRRRRSRSGRRSRRPRARSRAPPASEVLLETSLPSVSSTRPAARPARCASSARRERDRVVERRAVLRSRPSIVRSASSASIVDGREGGQLHRRRAEDDDRDPVGRGLGGARTRARRRSRRRAACPAIERERSIGEHDALRAARFGGLQADDGARSRSASGRCVRATGRDDGDADRRVPARVDPRRISGRAGRGRGDERGDDGGEQEADQRGDGSLEPAVLAAA